MMMKSLICLSLILLPLVSVVEGLGGGGGLGSRKPIKNVSDPDVVAVAKYAIEEHNKESKEKLVFVKVVEGTTQVVSGTKYDLKIAAKDGGGLGSRKPIKNVSDPDVVAVAKYAIEEHNKESKEKLVFVKVVEGTTQVVSGTKYDLKIAAKDGGGKIKNYEAVVVEKLWLHSKSLESFKAL